MKENEHNKTRLSQLEDLMANTLRNVDKLTADMQVFREYAFDNTKIVNEVLRKLDDHSEQINKTLSELATDRKENEQRRTEEQKIREEEQKIREEDQKLRAEDQKLRDAQFAFLLKRTESAN